MGNVYANGKEVSSKKTTNKSAPAMMSVCLSPPSPPAGPVPIPYPVTDMASNTTDGTGSVFIKKKEVGKKNGSNYKKCKGNEPATRNFGMDVVSHTIQGKTKFEAYSFDVMFEKDGAERFTDLTSTNHMNPASAFTASNANANNADLVAEADCKKLKAQNDGFRETLNEELVEEDSAHVNNNHTVASGAFFPTPGGGAGQGFIGTSCTSFLAHIYSALSQPTPSGRDRWIQVEQDGELKNHVASEACPGCTQPIGGQQCHAELNIINHIGRTAGCPPGGRVLLSIDWMSGGEQQAPEPCTNCQNRIQCICENNCLQVVICDENDDPVDWCDR